MAELLFEILCEEIPARMQAKAGADLGRMAGDALKKAGLAVADLQVFTGPRRLVLVADVPLRSPDVSEERKGPRTSAPEQALAGFMRGAGISDISQAETRSDKKGEYYVAMLETKGRDASDIVAETIPEITAKFPWPKSMKSGTTNFRWVRPLQSLLCLLGGKVVSFSVNGFETGDETTGHRRMGGGVIRVKDFADYKQKLEGNGHVILAAQDRKDIILKDAKSACSKAGLELVEDEGLLSEVAGLAEWPVVILGDMDPSFLELPGEVIRLSMRTHQKYFAVRDPKTGNLAPNFIVVANQIAPDGGKEIAKGNSRVLSARLADAQFFQSEDAKTKLIDNYDKLDGVIFHKKLGSIKDKSERVAALARELAPKVGADPDKAEQAAKLAKCDLVTNMVVEFTSLQGQIGRLMYEGEGGDKDIAIAIEDHYKPQGPSDAVPTNPVAVAVALADKLDTLVGFWAIDEKPTGSKDPFALRRAALGLVRLIDQNNLKVDLSEVIVPHLERLFAGAFDDGLSSTFTDTFQAGLGDISNEQLKSLVDRIQRNAILSVLVAIPKDRLNEIGELKDYGVGSIYEPEGEEWFKRVEVLTEYQIQVKDNDASWEDVHEARAMFSMFAIKIKSNLLAFIFDRLKGHLREQDMKHDVIDAVFALGGDDLVDITKRTEALQAFLSTDDGTNLLAGYKRAANILKAEAKKGDLPDAKIGKGSTGEEGALFAAIGVASPKIETALADENYSGAMKALAELRGPIDAFFDGVIVNSDDVGERENRLGLLMEIRTLAKTIADFDKIEGA